MRPLPVEPLAGAPPFVLGLSIIRAIPVPVVDAAALLGETGSRPTRFVTVKAGAHRVAISVAEIVGLRAIGPETLHALPPLLREAGETVVASIRALDHELLVVLQSARLVSDEVFVAAELGGSAR
jgi:purine-binding chemotaxis protein CheW